MECKLQFWTSHHAVSDQFQYKWMNYDLANPTFKISLLRFSASASMCLCPCFTLSRCLFFSLSRTRAISLSPPHPLSLAHTRCPGLD